MTVNELIAKAIDEKDAKAAGKVVDRLRNAGLNYHQIFSHVLTVRREVTAAEWDELLYYADFA